MMNALLAARESCIRRLAHDVANGIPHYIIDHLQNAEAIVSPSSNRCRFVIQTDARTRLDVVSWINDRNTLMFFETPLLADGFRNTQGAHVISVGIDDAMCSSPYEERNKLLLCLRESMLFITRKALGLGASGFYDKKHRTELLHLEKQQLRNPSRVLGIELNFLDAMTKMASKLNRQENRLGSPIKTTTQLDSPVDEHDKKESQNENCRYGNDLVFDELLGCARRHGAPPHPVMTLIAGSAQESALFETLAKRIDLLMNKYRGF